MRALRRQFAEDAEPGTGAEPETIVLKARILRTGIRRICVVVGAGICSSAFIGVIAGYIEERADAQRSAEPQRVPETRIPIVAGAIHQETESAEGRALSKSASFVHILSFPIIQDPEPCKADPS